MLVLSRKIGQSIVIGETIEIMVTGIMSNRVRIGVRAPDSVRVRRSEIAEHDEPRPVRLPPPGPSYTEGGRP